MHAASSAHMPRVHHMYGGLPMWVSQAVARTGGRGLERARPPCVLTIATPTLRIVQTKRALHFLDDLFALVEERVVFVVTHSGFTRSVLLAVGREPYRPQNTELVPVIIVKHTPYKSSGAAVERVLEVQAADVA